MSSYHNTMEDLADHVVGEGHVVAFLEGKAYDRASLPSTPTVEVVTMIEDGKVRGIGSYWDPTPVQSLPQAPELLEGLPCHWYDQERGWEFSESGTCKNRPVAMGNGVSGPGFVAMCAEHVKDDIENALWGFAWWYPVRVTIRDLDGLLWEGELRPGRGY